MKRILIFKDGIIRGDIKRDIIDIFPETEHSFKQRKTFDEYYYDNTEVEIDLDKIEKINKYYSITFYSDSIIID
jgi:hypothetical protein